MVGDEEVLGGQIGRCSRRAPRSASGPTRSPSRPRRPPPSPAASWRPISARSWPIWNCGSTASCSNGSTSTSSRRNRGGDPQSILLLENNIEDVCRELNVFGPENEPLLEEITGLTLRDHLVNQLIMETGTRRVSSTWPSLTTNEFDVPATLVPEREAELHGLLQFLRERLKLARVPRREPAGAPGGERLQRHLPPRPPAPAPRAAQVPDPADAEEGPQGHDLRLRAAAGPAPRADGHRNHGREQRPDLRRARRHASSSPAGGSSPTR